MALKTLNTLNIIDMWCFTNRKIQNIGGEVEISIFSD